MSGIRIRDIKAPEKIYDTVSTAHWKLKPPNKVMQTESLTLRSRDPLITGRYST